MIKYINFLFFVLNNQFNLNLDFIMFLVKFFDFMPFLASFLESFKYNDVNKNSMCL